jgi:hypothetical protein
MAMRASNVVFSTCFVSLMRDRGLGFIRCPYWWAKLLIPEWVLSYFWYYASGGNWRPVICAD